MKRKLLTAFVAVILTGLSAFLFVLILNLVVMVNGQSYFKSEREMIDGNEKAECILVLGAGLRRDGTPTLILCDRLKRAAALYNDGVSDIILVTGDNSTQDYNEVQSMEDYLVSELDVPREAIIKDYAGFSTYDSMYRAKEVFCVKKAVVVTQRYHLYRAVYVARGLGIDAVGVPGDYDVFGKQLIRDIREIAARAKDFFSVIIKPEPKFLGEKIPING